ncbi:response regulator transcription factor [Lishizhenia sp.]|uniref:response regulator transcription factor n=1 Tax=Lishizhenia sp. TaxID=2497594 RepID=UPI00299EE487|nr:response regulator transcription factor [Lishizhenia sp.]MDX1445657.1 response regulator transcription factor [Lishizhenia sp.]
MENINIAVVDDHKLFRSGLANLIQNINQDFRVVCEADHGKHFLDQLERQETPDLALVDINMPVMDGFQTVKQLKELYPNMKLLIVTMNDDDTSLLKMLRLGIKGYISKDVDPEELERAILDMVDKGFHYTEQMTSQLIGTINGDKSELEKQDALNAKELRFIELACSEDTYDKIADKMCLSVKTIDNYRASVFDKLGVKSRVGLVMYAMQNGLFI